MFKKIVSICLIIFLIVITSQAVFAVDDNSTISVESIEEPVLEDFFDEIHVDIKGNDDNQGDALHPVSSIKKAINISKDSSKIIVHEGVYKESNLNINKSLQIQGQGNVVIDAENKDRIITINSNTTEHVVLSGITFLNGNSNQMAGAIYVLKAVTTIDNCKFINNTAATEGGAIFWNSEHGKLTNSLFENNYARDGSAIKWGESDTSISIGDANYGDIINCTFKNNHLMQDDDACIGLAIYSNNVNIINSTFIDHKTKYNSSFEVLYINGDSATVSGCTFANNTMTMTGALGFDGNYAKAFNNIFMNNLITYEDSFGGAIGIQSETASIFNNTFINNGGSKSKGGAIYINSVETFSFIFINVTDNVFVNNKAYYGAGIYANGNSNMLYLIVRNNTFTGESADTGAAVYLTSIYNPTIIENNTYKNLRSQMASGIFAYSSILTLNKNIMIDCSSVVGENIYTNGEITSDLKLKFNDIVGSLNQSTILTAVLTDDMDNKISSKAISFTVNGEKVKGNVSENKVSAFITVNDILNYGKSVSVNVTLTNGSGDPIKNQKIIVNLQNNDILLTTNEKGSAQFKTNLDYGKYTANFKFKDDEYYKSANKTITISVLNSISSNDMIRAYNSGIDFKATFYNGTSLLKNAVVTFNINGKNYKVLTDSKGVAVLNQKLSVGTYNVFISNPVTGDEAYNKLSVVKRITNNKNIKVYFTEIAVYKIRVFDDNGNPAKANQAVKVSVNKKSYNLKTDKNGYVTLKLKYKPGSYTISASYKNVKVSNKLTVKKILFAKNISKKKSKKIKFTAKLAKGKKTISGKKLKFKIKGKTYKVKTNKKGIAKLTLKNLKKGKHVIYTYYSNYKIKNTIRIK